MNESSRGSRVRLSTAAGSGAVAEPLEMVSGRRRDINWEYKRRQGAGVQKGGAAG